MRIHAEKERTIDFVLLSIQTNGLSDGEDVPFVECRFESRTAMTGGSERYSLFGHGGIRNLRIVSRDEARNIDQHGWLCRFTRERTDVFHPRTTSIVWLAP